MNGPFRSPHLVLQVNLLLCLCSICLLPASSLAQTNDGFDFCSNISSRQESELIIRIGDVDGYGYGTAEGYKAVHGGPANVDGVGVLGTGDFLPDLNRDGIMAPYRGDDYDHRDSQELSNSKVYVKGATDIASSGSNYTDIALSTSYDQSRERGKVHLANGTYGSGGPFPHGRSRQLPNQASIIFHFNLPKNSINNEAVLFIIVGAGMDESRPTFTLTKKDGTTRELSEGRQADSATGDGLIEALLTELPFDDIFTSMSEDSLSGFVQIDVVASEESYMAIDYAELCAVSPAPKDR